MVVTLDTLMTVGTSVTSRPLTAAPGQQFPLATQEPLRRFPFSQSSLYRDAAYDVRGHAGMSSSSSSVRRPPGLRIIIHVRTFCRAGPPSLRPPRTVSV